MPFCAQFHRILAWEQMAKSHELELQGSRAHAGGAGKKRGAGKLQRLNLTLPPQAAGNAAAAKVSAWLL